MHRLCWRQQVQIASPAYCCGDTDLSSVCRCNNSRVLSPTPPLSIFVAPRMLPTSIRLWDFHVASSTRGTPVADGTFHRRRCRFRLLNGRRPRGALNRQWSYDKIAHFERSYSLPRILPLSSGFSFSSSSSLFACFVERKDAEPHEEV